MTNRDHALVLASPHDIVAYDAGGPASATSAPAKDRTRDAPPPPPRARLALYVLLAVALVLLLGAILHWRSYTAARQAQREQQDFVPTIRTAIARTLTTPVDLTLPGQTEAFDTANIYPRATGYVAERRVDIGSVVHKGDLLIRIDAPDLDQQLAQAQAQIGQSQAAILQAQSNVRSSQASTRLAYVNRLRETTLAGQGFQTQQNADAAITNASVQTSGVSGSLAGVAVANANLKAQQATVKGLQALQSFEQVTAPFDGTVTARTIDTGDLLTAGAAGTPMLTLARTDILRVAVYVPQSNAVALHDGLQAKITIPELPGQSFTGTVARTADALDPASRSMLAEVDVPNPTGALRAGLYVQVAFAIPRPAPAIVVPDEALIFNAAGLQVMTVAPDHTVQFRKVTIARDFGTTAELSDGLDGGETLVLSPPASLHDGSKVQIGK